MELNSQNRRQIMGIVAFGIILYMILQNFGLISTIIKNIIGILNPFLIGAVIAFIINIPMKFLEQKILKSRKKKKKIKQLEGKNKVKRFLSIFLSLLIVSIILVALIRLVVPELLNVIKTFIQYLSGLSAQIAPTLNNIASNYPELGDELSKLQIDFSNILNSSIEFLKNAGSGFVAWIGKTVSSAVSGIANFVIGIIFAFYLLMSKEKIGKNIRRIILAYLPEKYSKKTIEIMALSKNAFTNFITGQLKEAAILGVLCYIGMLILKIPYSLTISLLTMVTVLVPIVGAFIGATIGVILLLSVSPMKAIIFLIFIIVLQQIETNLIYPKVVGESVGLPGVIVLVAITLGGSLWGAIGMLVSLPVASVLYTLLRASVAKKLKEKNLNEIV